MGSLFSSLVVSEEKNIFLITVKMQKMLSHLISAFDIVVKFVPGGLHDFVKKIAQNLAQHI
jgi:hypothetical protein